jgi:hypothetical protein
VVTYGPNPATHHHTTKPNHQRGDLRPETSHTSPHNKTEPPAW